MNIREFRTKQEMDSVHRDDISKFPLGFAFSDKQFEEMMAKWGLKTGKKSLEQICSLGAGGYIRKSDIPAWKDLMTQHKKEKEAFNNKSFNNLVECILFEMNNHEYGYTRNKESTLMALGLSYDDISNNRKKVARAWKQAEQLCFQG